MPKNAKPGTSALYVFVTMVNAYSSNNIEINLTDFKGVLKKELPEFFKDTRTRSAENALEILSEYSLIEERKNMFGTPVYSLKDKLDASFSIFLNTLAFLEDMTKGRSGDTQVLERIESTLPAIIEVLRTNGCFVSVPKENENILLSIFEALASEQDVSLYATLKFFYEQPQILRLYNMFAWLAIVSRKYGGNKSVETVLATFYEACKNMIPMNLDPAEMGEEKTKSLLKTPSFRDIFKLHPAVTNFNTRPDLPEKVRKKIDAPNKINL